MIKQILVFLFLRFGLHFNMGFTSLGQIIACHAVYAVCLWGCYINRSCLLYLHLCKGKYYSSNHIAFTLRYFNIYVQSSLHSCKSHFEKVFRCHFLFLHTSGHFKTGCCFGFSLPPPVALGAKIFIFFTSALIF